jgi:HAD superfamily hydrolase (TIGR01509 family)
MHTPDVVVFDLGKVLVDFDYSRASTRLSAQGNVSAADIRRLIEQSDLLFRFETGAMTAQEFFEQVRRGSGFQGGFEEFREIFADIFAPIPEMIEMHAALRQRGVRTFIFSNTNEIAVPHIRSRYPFFSTFDGYILSYEHGAMKPDARIYEVVERQTGASGARILYIDDRIENIEAGARRGWQVILQEHPSRTREQVRVLALLPD